MDDVRIAEIADTALAAARDEYMGQFSVVVVIDLVRYDGSLIRAHDLRFGATLDREAAGRLLAELGGTARRLAHGHQVDAHEYVTHRIVPVNGDERRFIVVAGSANTQLRNLVVQHLARLLLEETPQ